MMSLQLPRLRYDRIRWVLFVLIVVMLLIAAVARKKASYPKDVVVTVAPLSNGEKLISERDVKIALVRTFGNDFNDVELGELEIDRVEQALEEDPFVADANAYVDANNSVHVEVQQRQPLLRILDNKGGNYYLDGNGVKMPPSKNFAARALIATGNIAPYTPDFQKKRRNTLRDCFNLAQTLQEDAFLAGFIQQIHINHAGDFILIPLVGDQQIILGGVRNLDDKLKRLKTFYREGMPYTGWNQYRSINLKYNGQVVCRK